MRDVPEFYGITSSNMAPEALWSRDLFPRSFSVALMNYLRDTGQDVNIIHLGEGNGCTVAESPIEEVVGTKEPVQHLRFDFDSMYKEHLDIASGIPTSDLIITGPDGKTVGRFDMQASVIPDSSTKGLSSDLMGPEMTVRTPSLKNCALSMASSMLGHDDITEDLAGTVPSDLDWTSWEQVSEHVEDIICSLDALERKHKELQRPFLLQSVWKTEDEGPLFADEAMDVFVWTDLAFSRLFLDSVRRSTDGSPTRPVRCAVRLFRMVYDIVQGRHPDLDRIIMETSYGISGNREFMVNGRTTNRYMSCKRLSHPSVGSSEIPGLASRGFESMIVPERRLDSSVYYAVRAAR